MVRLVGGAPLTGRSKAGAPLHVVGIRHHSPASALAVIDAMDRWAPGAVAIEAPEDAADWIATLGAPSSRGPLWMIARPTRKTSSWRVDLVWTSWGPEWTAIREAARRGLPVHFIDVPFSAMQPSAPGARRPPVDAAWWEAHLEALPWDARESWCDAAHQYGEIQRMAAGQEALANDGTHARESHMAWRLRAIRRSNERPVLAVCGALHAKALAEATPVRVRGNGRAQVRLMPLSDVSAGRLVDRWPAWDRARAAGQGADAIATAAVRLARDEGFAAATSDATTAVSVATELARLQGRPSPSGEELLDVLTEVVAHGRPRDSLREVLKRAFVGTERGHVEAASPPAPLSENFHRGCRCHHLPLDGRASTVVCEVLRRPEHRERSAWLHRCALIGLPVFGVEPGALTERPRGPRLTERWPWCAGEELPMALEGASGLGETIQDVAMAVGARRIRDAADLEQARTAFTDVVQADLPDLLDPALRQVENRLAQGSGLTALTETAVALLWHHDTPLGGRAVGHPGVLDVGLRCWQRAVAALAPSAAAGDVADWPRVLRELVRLAKERTGLDRRDLCAAAKRLVEDDATPPAARGACLGALASLGQTEGASAAHIVRRVAFAGPDALGHFVAAWLAGARGSLLADARPLDALRDALGDLPWESFLAILPGLRRAFADLTPYERGSLGRTEAPEFDDGVVELDERPVLAALSRWSL